MANPIIDETAANITGTSIVRVNAPASMSTLSDPAADRIMMWDESADEVAWLGLGSGLSISGTTLSFDITGENLSTLADVTITSIASGELLKWNGSAWVNNTLAEVGVSAVGHTHDHGAITGLTDDDHGQYALLAGRAGDQTLIGSLDSGGDLTLQSTSHGTKGVVTSADRVTLTKEATGADGTAVLEVGDDTPATGDNLLQIWRGFFTDQFLFEINSDDWMLANNAYFDGTDWIQPVNAPSTLFFQASGGQGFMWYTAAPESFPGDGWIHHCKIEGPTSTFYIGGNDSIGTGEFPTYHSLYIGADAGDGTTSTRPRQIIIANATDVDDKMEIGLDSDGTRTAFGVIQVLEEAAGWRDLILCPGGGNVGIGATVAPITKLYVVGDLGIPATYKFYLDGVDNTYIFEQAPDVLQCVSGGSGGVKLTSGATTWAAVSDERLKTIIEPITDAVAKVGKIQGYIGRFNDDAPDRRRAFLIAQEVREVLPEAVVEGEDGFLSLKYAKVIPLLVVAINELAGRVDELERAA